MVQSAFADSINVKCADISRELGIQYTRLLIIYQYTTLQHYQIALIPKIPVLGYK